MSRSKMSSPALKYHSTGADDAQTASNLTNLTKSRKKLSVSLFFFFVMTAIHYNKQSTQRSHHLEETIEYLLLRVYQSQMQTYFKTKRDDIVVFYFINELRGPAK